MIYVWAAFAMENVGPAFQFARNRGLYILADVLGTTSVAPPHANGLTGFSVGMNGLPRTRHRLRPVISAFKQAYDLATAHEGYDFIPAGSCQYDDEKFMRARGRGETPLQVLAKDVSEIELFMQLALDYSRPINGTRYVMWGTLNNWAEGTTILPTKNSGPKFRTAKIGHYRFEHLKALKKVIFDGNGPELPEEIDTPGTDF